MLKRSAADPARREQDLHHPVTTQAPNGQDRPRCYNAVWQGNRVCLLERVGDRVVKRDVLAEYSCFIPAHQIEPVLSEVTRSSRVRGARKEGDWYRVRFASWNDRKDVCAPERGVGTSVMQRNGLDCYEADLNPVKRWLVDNDVEIQRPRRVYLDIEADSRVPFSEKSRARILCWVLVDHDTGRTVLGMLEADTDAAERDLLEDLWFELQDFDQVAAWYGGDAKEDSYGYDFPMIVSRSKRLGINVDPRRWLWVDQLEIFKKFNASSGESGDEKATLSLDSVAKKLLGHEEGKLEGVDGSMSWLLWELGNAHYIANGVDYGPGRPLLGRYCVRDTGLLRRVEEKTGFLELLYVIGEACGCFPDNYGSKGVNYVENFVMRLGHRQGMRFPSNWRDTGRNPFDGARVFEPTETGIIHNVHVCDFSGMYPSIIQTFNLSYETHAPELRAVKGTTRPAYLAHVKESEAAAVLPPGYCRIPITGEAFRTSPPGILVQTVDAVREKRKYYDKKKAGLTPGTHEFIGAERGAQGAKIFVNTFFGVASSPFSRLYKREVGEAITQTGVWLIETVAREATKRGMRFLYGDTDSGYIAGTTEAEFRTFIKELNEVVFPALLKDLGCTRNMIDIAYEKEFETLILLPSKKRYAGRYRHYKGKLATAESKAEIKGLEYKRGDTAKICREFQRRTIELLLSGDERLETYVALVAEERARVLDGALDSSEFVMSKRMSGSIESYSVKKKNNGDDSAQPIHVQVARRMRELGMDVSEGTRVQYVVVDAADNLKAVPLCEYVPGSEDRFYLWENLVYPATQRVLEACFKTHDWRLYERARPPKPRRGKPVPEEQTGFDFSANPGLPAEASPAHEITQRSGEVPGGRDSSGPAGGRDAINRHTGANRIVLDRSASRAAEAPQPVPSSSRQDDGRRGDEPAAQRRPRSAAGRAPAA